MAINNLVRRASPIIIYKKKDITELVKPFLTSIEFIENLEGVFDEITLKFDNKNNIFLKKNWAFDKDSNIEVGIRTLNWESELDGIKEKIVGIYNVDCRKFTHRTTTIKGISAPLAAKNTKHNNIYNKITLKELGEKIAKKYKLEYFYKAEDDIKLHDIKQEDKTDFSFLHEVASEQGIKVKITHSKLVLFEEELLSKEKSKQVFDIDYFTEFEINDKSDEIYDAVELTYYNALEDKKKKIIITKAELEGKKDKSYKKLFKVKARPKNNNLKKFAKAILQRENRRETEINFSTIGILNIWTGQVITIVNAGEFSGDYLITRYTHTLPKFETKIEAYKLKRSNND